MYIICIPHGIMFFALVCQYTWHSTYMYASWVYDISDQNEIIPCNLLCTADGKMLLSSHVSTFITCKYWVNKLSIKIFLFISQLE